MFSKCLSCQRSESPKKLSQGYHKKCSNQLFGSAQPPNVPFNSTDVSAEAQKMIGRMSISGVQPKLSAIHDPKNHTLTVVDRGGLLILKPPTDRFELLPENENLCMNIASAYGIETPPHGLLPLSDGKLTYIVKRFDRLDDGSKLQQEDFQQLLETDDKYAGSYERIANFIKKHSDVPGLDLVNLFERALLFYVLGNGDAHLKNFSLLRKEDVGYQLSPAYDIVSSRLVLPEEREEMCLSLQGKRNNILKEDFKGLSEHMGLSSKQVDNAFERLNGIGYLVESMIRDSFLGKRLKDRFLDIFKERMQKIFG
jgi:serine/threonine-protein kinase HipA